MKVRVASFFKTTLRLDLWTPWTGQIKLEIYDPYRFRFAILEHKEGNIIKTDFDTMEQTEHFCNEMQYEIFRGEEV
ncbi:cytochrome P450 [Leptospira noguchii]|uniref:Uncharacterized protein n=1 Tax=Leptospira noguchii str. 2001034031 TaxID=1193053 RepID=M6YHH7_9LEPT|nr:hypothetical protein [Leptospira noguchii]EMI71069.1 hypothetical protein LEP1GSC072_1483 [Leptospira noguchii str. Bonito]EMO91306.1 hypothetical protein LEP1GSC024_3078 [Leptospira noguchii str. 2001034031]EMS87370.1 hypothetical protein LEP1GSC073_0108 [Leptospira noguchii str. Cascata]UOG38417.1 cytochrome P450 [Leptospira noguchii]